MRNTSEAVFELLEEIDEICREYEIKYCLEGTAVRDAYCINDFSNDITEANISMDTVNIKKFFEVMKDFKKENRLFESPLNTKKKRNFVARYLNTKSFYMDLKKTNEAVNKCIRVNIHMRLNKYDNPQKSKAKKLQIAWKCGANDIRVLYKNIIPCSIMKIARAILGEIRVGKKVWEKWISYNEKVINYDSYNEYLISNNVNLKNVIAIMREALSEKQNADEPLKMSEISNYSRYSIIRRRLPMLTVNGEEIPAFLYDELTEISIKGRKFPVPKETDIYLWFRLGIKKGFNIDSEDINEDIIMSENISYDMFKQKHKKYLKKNRKLKKFFERERIIRGVIRLPITKMFKEFEKSFFNSDNEIKKEEVLLNQ